MVLPCSCIPLCPAGEENQHPRALPAAGGALPGPPPPACPAAPRHGGRAASAPASISPLSVPTSFLSLCPRSVHVLPSPRVLGDFLLGAGKGSPSSAASALPPSPNLPGCAGRGVLAAGKGEPAACAAPPPPQNDASRCQGDPNIGGSSESHKKSVGLIRAWLPPRGAWDGGEQPGARGEDLVPASHPKPLPSMGGMLSRACRGAREERGLLRGQELCAIATAFWGGGGVAGGAGMPRRAPCPGTLGTQRADPGAPSLPSPLQTWAPPAPA